MLLAILPEEEQAKAAAEKKAELVAECEEELGRVRSDMMQTLKST